MTGLQSSQDVETLKLAHPSRCGSWRAYVGLVKFEAERSLGIILGRDFLRWVADFDSIDALQKVVCY